METIAITSKNLPAAFEQLQVQLGGKLFTQSKELRLELKNDLVDGSITGIYIENAIAFIEFEITFKKDISFLFNMNNEHLIHFGYCSKGELYQRFQENPITNTLSQFQTGIFSVTSQKYMHIEFKKEHEVKFSLITVDVNRVSDAELQEQLHTTFLQNTGNQSYSYIGSYNLKIGEKIQYLHDISQKGLIRNLLINSTVYLILALEIEQHKHDLQNTVSTGSKLSKANLEAVRAISEYIKINPEIAYSLKFLSKKAGMSNLKLQEGFKILHNRTVGDYIKNSRVEAAEHLIRTSELNISEIVYTVGLTSRSYFSKIFREKYNCCPKQYKDHQHVRQVVA